MSRKKLLSLLIAVTLAVVPLLLASVRSVDAANLTEVSDTLSDSGIGADSEHVISFVATSGIAAAESITLTFDDTGDAFNFGSVAVADMSMTAGACGSETGRTLGATPSGATWGVNINSTSDVITITSATDTVGTDECVNVTIGSTNYIANPSSSGVYDIDVATTSDTGVAKVAILDHVVVDVTVDETLTFTVAGQTGAAQCVTTADIDTTSTAVSYGSVNANQFYTACQELTVSTNASDGYSVTVQQDGNLTSAALDEIAAGSCDGTCTVGTEAAWGTAGNNGFGYCLDNVTGTDAQTAAACGAGTPNFRLFGTLGTDTPEVIMSNASVVDTNAIEIGYKISVSGTQQAGIYENDVIFVATPVY